MSAVRGTFFDIIRSCMVGSDVVATCSCSQLIGMVEMAAQTAVWRPSSWMASVESMLSVQAGLGDWMSSGRWSLGGVRVPDGWRERASLV